MTADDHKGRGGTSPILKDLVLGDPDPAIRVKARIHRSRVFARILGFVIYKGAPISPTESARELSMDVWVVNKTFLELSRMGLLKRRKREGSKLVFYHPNGETMAYKKDVVEALQGRKP